MGLNTYNKAKAAGYKGDQLIGAFMWLGSYDDWVGTLKGDPISKQIFNDFVIAPAEQAEKVLTPIEWVLSNWQVSVVGGIALLLLIKRL